MNNPSGGLINSSIWMLTEGVQDMDSYIRNDLHVMMDLSAIDLTQYKCVCFLHDQIQCNDVQETNCNYAIL